MGGSKVRGLMRGLIGALLPVQCAGCRAWDEVLCPACRSLAGRPAHVASIDGGRGLLPLVAMGDYDGPLRRIVLAAKHSGRTDVTDFLDEAGARLGTALGGVLGLAGSPAAAVGVPTGRGPSTGSAVDVWVVRVRVVDAVRLRVGATSQSGKAGAQRTVGRMGSMRALAVPGPGVRVVAVDDVVTTGATVREMERVLGGLDAVVTLCRPGLIS